MAAAIPRTGSPPSLVQALPQKGLIGSQVHYFHDWPSLNRRFPLAEDNLLNLNSSTEGLLARYRSRSTAGTSEETRYAIVLIGYPSPAEAETARQQFCAVYLPETETPGMIRTEKNTWTAMERENNILIGIFDAPSREEINRLINEVRSVLSR
jgi:hypothetical protein